jgi:hypothetical protein
MCTDSEHTSLGTMDGTSDCVTSGNDDVRNSDNASDGSINHRNDDALDGKPSSYIGIIHWINDASQFGSNTKHNEENYDIVSRCVACYQTIHQIIRLQVYNGYE